MRKDSLLANYYYSKLPKAKVGLEVTDDKPKRKKAKTAPLVKHVSPQLPHFNRKPNADYTLENATNENQRWPVNSKVMQQIIASAIGMGYDPKQALAVALQETSMGMTDPNWFHVLFNKDFPEKYRGLTEDELGIQILKDKAEYANNLGYTGPLMELQTYNGLGKIFRNTENKYHGFNMQKIYGVPIPPEGIDMKKNPLYGKRILDYKKNVIDQDPYVDQLVDYYKNFYNNPDSRYYTKETDLPPVIINAKKKYGGPLSDYYNSRLPKAQVGQQVCDEGLSWNEQRQACTTLDGRTFEELKASNDATWDKVKLGLGLGTAAGVGAGVYIARDHPLIATLPDIIKSKNFKPYNEALLMALLQKGSYPFAKLPFIDKLYKKGAKRIGSLSTAGSRDLNDIKQAIFNNKVGDYTGFLGVEWDPNAKKYVSTIPNRNLLNNYIYGDNTAFTESDIPYQNLEEYEKMYNTKFKTYKLHDSNPDVPADINDYIYDFITKKHSDDSLVYPELSNPDGAGATPELQKKYLYDLIKEKGSLKIGSGINLIGKDNIAGHMRFLTYDPATGNVYLTTQDLWKFAPKKYGIRWGGWDGVKFKDFDPHGTYTTPGAKAGKFLKSYSKYKQAQMMDRAGTPFVLNDRRPVDFGQDFSLDMNYADDAIPYEGPIIKPSSVSTRLSPAVIDLSKKPASFFDDVTYDVTTGRWVPKSDKSVEVGTDFIGPTTPTETSDWETVSREGYSLEEPTDYSGLDPEYKAVSDEVKSIGDVDAATWAEKYKEAMAKYTPPKKITTLKLEKTAPKAKGTGITPEVIANVLKNKVYSNTKITETPRETKKVEGLKNEEALNAIRKVLRKGLKLGKRIKLEYGGDISVPNVYPNQMNPRFEYGGPLVDYYQGKMNGPNMFADGGMITDPMGQWAHPGQNTRIPGGNITMDGVSYPVLAKASNGMSAIMQPGQDYNFPGATYVDEYPMVNGQNNNTSTQQQTEPVSDKRMSGLDWMKSWVSHPQFRERLANMGRKENLEEEQARMMGLLDKYQPKRYRDLIKDQGLLEWIKRSIDSDGVSYGTPEQVYVKHKLGKKGRAREESVRVHELTHMLENNGNWFNQDNKTALKQHFKKFRPGLRIGKVEQDDYDYFTNPTEVHARMNQAKAYFGLTPDQEFTEEMYDQMNKEGWFGLKKYLKDKQGFIKLINTYADNEPIENNTAGYSMLRQGGVASNQGYYNVGMGIPRFDEGGEDCPCPEFNCQCPPGYGTATRSDSIRVLQGALAQENWLKNNPGYQAINEKNDVISQMRSQNKQGYLQQLETAKRQLFGEIPMSYNGYYKNIDKNKFEQRELTTGNINKNIPIGIYDRRIQPNRMIARSGHMHTKDDLFFRHSNISGTGVDILKDRVEFPQYDPIAVTPWDMLSPEKQKIRLQKYGVKGTPYANPNYSSEPTLKPKPFVPATKLPIGQPATGMQIQQRTFPKLDIPNVSMSGPYMVGYHDYNTNEGIDKGFQTAEERDAFMQTLREREGGFGQGIGDISSYYNTNKRNKKQYGGLTKYQSLGEVNEQVKNLPDITIQGGVKTPEQKIADARATEKDYQTGWYNSPMYKQILNSQLSPGEEWMADERLKRLESLDNLEMINTTDPTLLGLLTADDKIYLNTSEHDDPHVSGSQTLGETVGHEGDHWINNRGKLVPKNMAAFMDGIRNVDPEIKNKKYRQFPNFSKSALFQKELAPYAEYSKFGSWLAGQPIYKRGNLKKLDQILAKRNEEENWMAIPPYDNKKTADTINRFRYFHNYYNQPGDRGHTEYISLVNKIRQDAKESGVWDPFTEPFTEEVYNKMIQLGNTDKTRDFRQLLNWHGTDEKGKKKTIDTFNKVAKNNNKQPSDMAKYGGGLLSRTVTCSRCGHSWKAVDGGADVATCHKCGGGIKMKHGGPLLQFYNNRLKR